jgi:hypothetical protein
MKSICTNMPLTVLIFTELMHVQQLLAKAHIPNFMGEGGRGRERGEEERERERAI